MNTLDDNNNEISKIIEEYQFVLAPNHEQLRNLINQAKGSLTMKDFSKECGISESTLSRAINGKHKKPLPMNILLSIANSVQAGQSITLEQLLNANGMIRKDSIHEANSESSLIRSTLPRNMAIYNKAFQSICNKNDHINKVKFIFVSDLLNKNHSIKSITDDSLNKYNQCDLGVQCHFSFGLTTDALESLGKNSWLFFTDLIQADPDHISTYVDNYCKHYASFFLMDQVDPAHFSDSKISFVLSDPLFFEQICDRFSKYTFVKNKVISIILVDEEKSKISKEFFIK